MEFPSKIEALEPWKIQLLRGTLWKITEIANSDFTWFLYPIWDAFWHSFWDLWAWFSIFVRPWFSVAFLDVFFMALGTKMIPKWLPEWTENLKKSKLVFSGSVWVDSTPIWLHFWSTLVAIWDVLGISWQPFGITFGHVWSLSGIFWSSSKDRLARCQVYSNTLNCPFCD